MITIAPSILSADFANLGRDVQRVREADWLHVDVMDGMFVSNISIGVPVVKSLRKFTDQFLDVHLMIEKPVRYVDAFADAGADLLTVHLEADMPPGIQAALAAMERRGVRKGIALRPITAAEAVLPYLDKVDLILVMTVEPGFGGQAFMADQLPKIAAIRRYIQERNPACRLEVDGGVDPVTARQVVEAGADVLVAGSAIYGAPDPPRPSGPCGRVTPARRRWQEAQQYPQEKEGRGSFMEYFPRIGKNGGTVCPPARHWP